MWLRLTSLNNKAILVYLNTNLLALCNLFWACFIKTHQILDWLCKVFLFHTDYFGNVLLSGKYTWQLSLVHDVVNSFNSHRIEKSNRCLFVVHVSHMSCQPFPSIFLPKYRQISNFNHHLLFLLPIPVYSFLEKDYDKFLQQCDKSSIHSLQILSHQF